MTLTHDRRPSCSPDAAVRGPRPRGRSAGSPTGPSVDFPPAASSRARARSGPASSSSSSGSVRRRPRRRDRRPARAGRVLRRAVGPRPDAAERPGRRDRADELPGARLVGLRGGAHRAAGARARRSSRVVAGAAARGHRRAPPLSGTRHGDAAVTDARSPMTGIVTFLFTDIEGSTRLEPALGTARYGDVLERHRELLARRVRGATAARSRAPRATRSSSSSTSARSAIARGRRGAARARRRAVAGRRRGPRPDGPACRRGDWRRPGTSSASTSTARRGSPRRPTAARSCLGRRSRALGGAGSGRRLRLRDLGEHRLKDLLAPERPRPARRRRPAARTSRRSARSTPGPTTCRPS